MRRSSKANDLYWIYIYWVCGNLVFSSVSLRSASEASSTLRRRNLKTEVSLRNCIKRFSSTLRWRNLKTGQSPLILGLCLRKTGSGKSHHHLSWRSVIQNVFRPGENEKPAFSRFLRFEERFQKAPFSWRISVDSRPNRTNKAVFSNFSGVVWTLYLKPASW